MKPNKITIDRRPIEDSNEGPTPVASFHVRKVITEHIPIHEMLGAPKKSYGEILDEILTEAAKNNDEVQSFEFEISTGEWYRIADEMRPKS